MSRDLAKLLELPSAGGNEVQALCCCAQGRCWGHGGCEVSVNLEPISFGSGVRVWAGLAPSWGASSSGQAGVLLLAGRWSPTSEEIFGTCFLQVLVKA